MSLSFGGEKVQIGFFDSGIGGITVLYEALKILPYEDYLYYADTSNVPYGTKPKNEVKKYISDAAQFIVGQGVKAIVIACNTATSVAIDDLRNKYNLPIIGMEPAVKPAVGLSMNKGKRVLVTATPLTLKEEKLKTLIRRVDNEHVIDLLPLPKLVEFAENYEFREKIVLPYLETQLHNFDMENYETIVLGCTHFPFYKDIFKKLLPASISIIDGNLGTVLNLKKILEDKNYTNEGSGKIVYYNSGNEVHDKLKLAQYSQLLKRLSSMNG